MRALSESRDRLLAAAVEYAAQHGISDLSLRALAAGLQTSHRMLIHHFGSKAGLLAAVVSEVERRQRTAFAELEAGSDLSLPELGRRTWARVADPQLWPYERLFFELYAQALQGREHTQGLLAGELLQPWFDQLTAIYRRRGIDPDTARAHARLGVAVTRGLLLDLLATGDRGGVDAAMEAFLELVAQAS